MEKSNLMMIVIIVLLVALLGTVVAVTLYAFNMVQNMETMAAHDGGWDRSVRTLLPGEITYVMIGDPITTNLSTADGGARGNLARLQLTVGFDNTQGSESDDMATRLEEQAVSIRMMALDIVGNRTIDELSAQGARDVLAAEILEILQHDFRTNMIVSVGFYEWLIT